MNPLQLFLPCAAGVEGFLADEVHAITGFSGHDLMVGRGGVMVRGTWRDAMLLNLHSRLAQRVLIQLSQTLYRSENDLYRAASDVAWEIWFSTRETFKIEMTAQHSPLTSLNFAALRVKDAIADRFRAKKQDQRPSVETRHPDVRVHVHLTTDEATIYIDTSGEALFKRGWREDKGDAPLKETLAAAMIAATGWDPHGDNPQPLYDPCCGSGTVVIEAAQIARRIPAGILRRFAFEKLVPFQKHVWDAMLDEAESRILPDSPVGIYGSDISFRMVDFAGNNADRAGVAETIQLRGGDALQRMPPSDVPGIMLLNPPYGERIAAAGSAGRNALERMDVVERVGRETAQTEDGVEFFNQLASHWKKNYSGWSAYMLTPDMKLPSKMRLKESRRTPMWNGPIECRLFRFDMIKGAVKPRKPAEEGGTA
ncbi:class I SAM-dependent RNA methyltransferase [Diaphorobacter sp. HDW4B]|uniref:THUMP domain-containing class I SAM-dependent RNA methyltransferase n=1 Tax=Diaphorobacter sp. HDW4B TaxID=2714925 RepID=UPI00140A8C3E|nr:THUMP domain-containing protein [Diaphorobacter sp. HDW4B]QIL70478.1 class I SAM-dependent RNA methyltransferase [Diaphorobacter sp. HDW4B]